MTDIEDYNRAMTIKSKTFLQKFYDEYKWMLNALVALIILKYITSGDQMTVISQRLSSIVSIIRNLIRHENGESTTRIFDDLRFEYDVDINKLPMVFAGIGLLFFVVLLS